jgi:hypothetical protein
MAKVQGLFVGYRKFAVDRDWLRQQEEQRYRDRQRQFDEWSRKWVTVTRLKETRLWTDGAIRRWLGEPQQQGKYKVFPVEAVLAAEKLNEFRLWLKPRLEKKRAQHHHFLQFHFCKSRNNGSSGRIQGFGIWSEIKRHFSV